MKKQLRKNDALDSQEFYEIMYSYRWADKYNQDIVILRFEDVKKWIRKNFKLNT